MSSAPEGRDPWRASPRESQQPAPAARLGLPGKALEVVLIPPVAVWELGRIGFVEALPALARGLKGAVLGVAHRLGAAVTDTFRGFQRLMRTVARAVGARLFSPVVSCFRVVMRGVRSLGLRWLVLARSVARVAGRVLRNVARPVRAAVQRLIVAARALAAAVAELYRASIRALRAVGQRALVAARAAARRLGLALRAAGRRLTEVARRLLVALRAAVMMVARALARPVRAVVARARVAISSLVVPLRRLWAWALGAARALRLATGRLVERLVLAPVRAMRGALRRLVEWLVLEPARWAWALLRGAARATRRAIGRLVERVVLGPLRATRRVVRRLVEWLVLEPVRWAWALLLGAARATRQAIERLVGRLLERLARVRDAVLTLLRALATQFVLAPARAARALALKGFRAIRQMVVSLLASEARFIRRVRATVKAAALAAAQACARLARAVVRPFAARLAIVRRASGVARAAVRDAFVDARSWIDLERHLVHDRMKALFLAMHLGK